MSEDWVPFEDWLDGQSDMMDELLRDFKRRVVYIETHRTVEVIARKPRARRGWRRKR